MNRAALSSAILAAALILPGTTVLAGDTASATTAAWSDPMLAGTLYTAA